MLPESKCPFPELTVAAAEHLIKDLKSNSAPWFLLSRDEKIILIQLLKDRKLLMASPKTKTFYFPQHTPEIEDNLVFRIPTSFDLETYAEEIQAFKEAVKVASSLSTFSTEEEILYLKIKTRLLKELPETKLVGIYIDPNIKGIKEKS